VQTTFVISISEFHQPITLLNANNFESFAVSESAHDLLRAAVSSS